MDFTDKLDAMARARADADAAYVAGLAGPRDAYVLAGRAHIEVETRWMDNLADADAQAAAQDSWRAVVVARKALTDALAAAAAQRDASLEAVWVQIRAGG